MNDMVIEFGKRVRKYRTDLGLSQEKLAELCGLHPTYIGQIERGEKNCTLESAEKISQGLKVPIDNLICKIITVDPENQVADDIYRLIKSADIKTQEKLLKIIKLILET